MAPGDPPDKEVKRWPGSRFWADRVRPNFGRRENLNSLRIVIFLVLIGLEARAAPASWDSMRLPANPKPSDITRYLGGVRDLVNVRPESTNHPENWQPPPLDKAVMAKARSALEAVPLDNIDLILKACEKAENDRRYETTEVYVETSPGTRTMVGYWEVRVRFRTHFTEIALDYVAHLTDVPAHRHKTYFEFLGVFPELIVGISQRPWLREVDPYLTPKLLHEIDRTTGWRGTARLWIACLLRMDTRRSWDALEEMITDAQIDVRLEAYAAVKELPDRKMDLDRCVAKAWKKYVDVSTRGNRAPFAAVAASHGVVEAVVELAEFVQKGWTHAPTENASAALLAVMDSKFSNAKEAADWVANNRRVLTFDFRSRKYRAPSLPVGSDLNR